jgi:hypothetical protein
MQLIYRGITYSYNQLERKQTDSVVPVASTQPTTQLRYRGSAYTVKFGSRPFRELLCYPIRNLLYRGASYKLDSCMPN